MKKPRTTRLLLAALGASVALGGIAIAGPGFGPRHGPPGGFSMHLMLAFEQLELTEAQEELVVRQHLKNRKQRSAMHEQMRADKEALTAELEKATPDRARIHALVDQTAERMKQHAHEHVDQLLDLHQTLTETQRAQLIEQLKHMRERRGPPPRMK